LILNGTQSSEFEKQLKKITQGAKWHNFETLKEELKILHIELPLEIVRKLSRITKDWTPGLRYECGRLDTGETRAFI